MLERCGVVMSDEQVYLLEARLAPVARAHAYRDVHTYVDAACAPGAARPLSLALIDAMTTHETFFFRDPAFWKATEEVIVPKITSGLSAFRPIRVWCAASSTGQEPYTLAMLFAERFPALLERLEITATDVSELSVKQGSSGCYSQLEVSRGLGAARLVRHFEQAEGGAFRVVERLRRCITWQPRNLLDPARRDEAYELVMCRNVLIYFGPEDRDRVVSGLYSVLAPTGCLGVGCTETISGTRLTAGWYTKESTARR